MSSLPFLVTGATDGIGFETAFGLAAAGHRVLVHGRTPEKAQRACDDLERRLGRPSFIPVHADFSRLDEVRALGERLRSGGEPLAGVIHNAGALFQTRTVTVDGWEAGWQVNHLAPFLLHNALDPLLAGGRIVWVSSMLHTRGTIPWDDLNSQKGYQGSSVYANTKLANALTAFRMARTQPDRSVLALHPGVVGTKLLRQNYAIQGVSPAEGARTSLFAALHPSLEGKTGLWLDSERPGTSSEASRDEALQDRLWDWSRKALGLG